MPFILVQNNKYPCVTQNKDVSVRWTMGWVGDVLCRVNPRQNWEIGTVSWDPLPPTTYVSRASVLSFSYLRLPQYSWAFPASFPNTHSWVLYPWHPSCSPLLRVNYTHLFDKTIIFPVLVSQCWFLIAADLQEVLKVWRKVGLQA